jgi:tetratricopeptide (TPR) repeat protein
MKRRYVILALLLLLVGVGGKVLDHFLSISSLPPPPLPTVRRDAMQFEAAAPEVIDPSKSLRLAIGSLGLPDDTQNARLGDLILTELTSTRGLELVERREMDLVLREAELSLSGIVRAKDAVHAGRLLHADWFLLGTLSTAANNSNAIVARIVDAHTGIMRDIQVFQNQSSTQLAAQLAGFVKDCRHGAGISNPHEYLAIGTFSDVSVNNRLPNLPSQLGAQLAAAYRGSHVTVLEREHMDTLFKEAELDLAGLADDSGGGLLPKLQSAFWLVNGYYQSYERGGFQVELSMRVQRIFGSGTNFAIRAAAGDSLFAIVKSNLDAVLAKPSTLRVPTRVTEIKSQIFAGNELAGIKDPSSPVPPMPVFDFVEPARSIIQRNLDQAIQAYQTALLLDPTNRQARVGLGFCLSNPLIVRLNDARELYRQVMEGGVRDHWGNLAQNLLVATFIDGIASSGFTSMSLEEKVHWWNRAASQSTNQSAAEFYKAKARDAERDLAIRQDTGTNVEALAEERLLQKLHDNIPSTRYMADFLKVFGTDSATGVERLNALLPRIKAAASNSYPCALASLVTFQTDTNSPVISEFESVLDWYIEHPQAVPKVLTTTFWSYARETAYGWTITNKDYDLSIKILKARMRFDPPPVGGFGYNGDDEDVNKMSLGFLYLATQKWNEALGIFESWSNCPVYMGNSGLWGGPFTLIRTSKTANYCRKQLGLAETQDPREFELQDTGLCFCEPRDDDSALLTSGTFATTTDSLWLGKPGRLIRFTFDLRTNLVVDLPVDAPAPTTALCFGPAKVWVGTGAGLVEYDKATGQCRVLTETNGLLMNYVAALKLIGDTLWMGFGRGGGGGIGKLDLASGRFISFAGSILNGDTGSRTSRGTVRSLAAGPGGDLYAMTPDAGVIRHRMAADDWQTLPSLDGDYCLASDSDHLLAGGRRNYNYKAGDFGVFTFDFKGDKWKAFPRMVQFPSQTVSTICVDGNNLWVGGMGYVVLLDPTNEKVLRFSYIRCRQVDRIEVGRGYIWAQFDRHLYRASLHDN